MIENSHNRTVQLNPEKLLGFRHLISSDDQGCGSEQVSGARYDLIHRAFSKLGTELPDREFLNRTFNKISEVPPV